MELLNPLARTDFLLRETETFEFLDVKPGSLRTITGYRLRLERNIARVFQIEYHMHQFTRMYRALVLPRDQLPGKITAHIGIKLHHDGSRHVDLCVYDRIRLQHLVNSGDLADFLVERHQRISKAEHQKCDDREFAKRFPVTFQYRFVHWKNTRRRKNPRKNAAATVASTIPVFTFRFSCCSDGEFVIGFRPGKQWLARLVYRHCFLPGSLAYLIVGGVSKL